MRFQVDIPVRLFLPVIILCIIINFILSNKVDQVEGRPRLAINDDSNSHVSVRAACLPIDPSDDFFIGNPEHLAKIPISISVQVGNDVNPNPNKPTLNADANPTTGTTATLRSSNFDLSYYKSYNPGEVQMWVKNDMANWDLINWRLAANMRNIIKEDDDYNEVEEEREEVGRRRRSSRRELTCIDVGGNLGIYSMFMIQSGCRVKLFEIQVELIALSTNTMYLNNVRDRVDIFHVGLSDSHSVNRISGNGGTAFISLGDSLDEIISIDPFHEVKIAPAYDCLKGATKNQNSKIDFIKIDVEGFEIRTLRGLMSVIKESQVDSLLVEIGPSRWHRAALSILDGIHSLHLILGDYKAYLIWKKTSYGSCHDLILSSNLSRNMKAAFVDVGVGGDEYSDDDDSNSGSYGANKKGDDGTDSDVFIIHVKWGREMTEILFRMADSGSDCDFWFDREYLPSHFSSN